MKTRRLPAARRCSAGSRAALGDECSGWSPMLVVVIGGPIASGKSTLSRAVATRLQERHGVEGAVIDLDLVYEMLDPQGRPKADPATWSAARRVAGRLASALLAEGRAAVVEGDFTRERALIEFASE